MLLAQNVFLKRNCLHFEHRYKRLEQDRFQWPQTEQEVITMQGRELAWLLDGLSVPKAEAHAMLSYNTLV